jgi:hypothetical protein
LIRQGPRFVVPGPVSQTIDAPRLAGWIREAWDRESRFPLRLAVTLRLAFRHMGLHVFKTSGGGAFLTSVCPAPVDPEQAVPAIRKILQHLAAAPGCTTDQLIEGLGPGLSSDSPEAGEVRKQLRWLVDKGHIIEFSDGRLAVPVTSVESIQHAKPRARRNQRSTR